MHGIDVKDMQVLASNETTDTVTTDLHMLLAGWFDSNTVNKANNDNTNKKKQKKKDDEVGTEVFALMNDDRQTRRLLDVAVNEIYTRDSNGNKPMLRHWRSRNRHLF